MDVKYTKTNPKILDYNPITHVPFYSPETVKQRNYRKSSLSISKYYRDDTLSPRPTCLVGRNIIQQSNIHEKQPELLDFKQNPKYQHRLRYYLDDPISGHITIYKLVNSSLSKYKYD